MVKNNAELQTLKVRPNRLSIMSLLLVKNVAVEKWINERSFKAVIKKPEPANKL
jgi:hypothetical protein